MKLNKNGFGAVAILIVIVVLSLIGFGVWSAYDSSQDSDNTNEATSQVEQMTATEDADGTDIEPASDGQNDTEIETSAPANWLLYEDESISFRYPDETKPNEDTEGSQFRTPVLNVLSNDYETEPNAYTYRVISGYSLDVFKVVTDDVNIALTELSSTRGVSIIEDEDNLRFIDSEGVRPLVHYIRTENGIYMFSMRKTDNNYQYAVDILDQVIESIEA